MGAGQIGGIATMLDIDFHNAAGFIGVKAEVTEAQFVVYFMSHAMMFCMGSLIEAHVVLTTASCVMGEKFKFDVYGGSHKFLEHSGTSRTVEHMCIHKGYNHSSRWQTCSPDNLALLVLGEQFSFNKRQAATEFVMTRLRYGHLTGASRAASTACKFYGWGSRRNGYMVPLLINLRRVDVTVLQSDQCLQMWNYGNKFLCIQQFVCKSSKHGALCPDDLGSVVECSGFLRGMMVSRLIDRPCGVGFIDMDKFIKFLTCGVDDSRDIIGHNDYMEFEFDSTTVKQPHMQSLLTVNIPELVTSATIDSKDPGPPKEIPKQSGETLEGNVPDESANDNSELPQKHLEARPETPPQQENKEETEKRGDESDNPSHPQTSDQESPVFDEKTL